MTKRLSIDKHLLTAVGNGNLYRIPFDKRYFYDDVEVVVHSQGAVEATVKLNHLDTQPITQAANAYARIEDLKAKARTNAADRMKMLDRLTYVTTYASFGEFVRKMKAQPDFTRIAEKVGNYKKYLIIYLAWMMLPSWAKSAAEYNAFWGDIANQISFSHAERD